MRAPLAIMLPLAFIVGMNLARDSAGGAGVSFLREGAAAVAAGRSADGAIIGTASVIDGDTLEIRGIRIRLDGIDAPEGGQPCIQGGQTVRCGQDSAFHLSDRIGRRPVSCDPVGTDRYGRTLAICYLDGEDLNAMMVRDGHAVAYRQYSRRYVPQEDEARRAGRGMWSGEFQMPWDWRRR